MHKTGPAAGYRTGQESHTQGFVVGNALESANQIRPFQVLGESSVGSIEQKEEVNKPSTRVSIDLSTHRANRFRQMDSERCS